MSASQVQREAERLAATLARPVVNLARPGVMGSTGDHLQRRRPRESEIIDAALDGLKRRYGWDAIDLAGFSGGGHVVAALLARRADIRFVVIASGNVAVRERLEAMARIVDVTGYHDFLDPLDLVQDVVAHPPRHVVVLTDPKDVVVSAASQTAYVEALRAVGVSVEHRFVTASDQKHHNLRNEAILAAAGLGGGVP